MIFALERNKGNLIGIGIKKGTVRKLIKIMRNIKEHMTHTL